VDVIAAKSPDSDQTQIIDLTHDIADTADDKPLMYLDIGPKTTQLYCELIKTAGTIFWNGPMGIFEKTQFAAGSSAIAKAMTKSTAVTVAGGGNTIAAIEHFKLTGQFDFVSAAGSAALEFLSGTILPGLAAIEHSPKQLLAKNYQSFIHILFTCETRF
jgi:3-phosphoglycerate kinase